MKKFRASLIALSLMSVMGSYSAQASQKVVDQISQFGVNYKVTDNNAAQHGVNCAALGADWASCNRAVITLTNHGAAVNSKDWAIYMSNVHQILKVESDQFRMVHIVGDLTRLEPTEKFKGFAAGESVDIPIVNEYWQLFMTDVMPRWYVTSTNAEPKVIAVTDTEDLTKFVAPFGEQWKRTPDDKNVLMTATSRFDKNSDISTLSATELRGQIVPTPMKVTVHDADADLSKGVSLNLVTLSGDKAAAIRERFTLMGLKESTAGYKIDTRIDASVLDKAAAIPGGYQLKIGKEGAQVTDFDQQGVLYGLQSILSLVPADGSMKIATLEATDAPRLAYRGVFLDVARNFHSKAAVLRMLDQAAAWKINVFHFHLSDDEGWRIEIPGLLELTQVGSKRCHDTSEKSCLLPQLGSGPQTNTNGSGYFTRQDYIDIVKYAAARGIEVIPEIDMPAHARAAVISMEARYDRLMKAGRKTEAEEFRLVDPTDRSNTTSVQLYDRTSYLNPCLPSSLRFSDKIISEIQTMHLAAGQPMKAWHFGGDEAKNIRLGPGYTDTRHPEAGKGQHDMRKEDKPWARSQVCQKMVKEGKIEDLEHLPSYFAVEVSKQVNAHGIEKLQAWQDGV
ncbi:MAG: Chitobiase [Candidatus Erwinia impunctatus]|nr:Chitobiase [Culicoides impunctatus]